MEERGQRFSRSARLADDHRNELSLLREISRMRNGGGIDVAGSGAVDLQSGPASQLERSACSESEQSGDSPLRRVTGTALLISNSFYFVIPT